MKKCGVEENDFGRSMIEMLGVLAIVGVLSIGGISGFQKAMNKHKINQVTEEFSQFINELLRYSKDWRRELATNKGNNMYLYSELDFFVSTKWRREGYWIYDGIGKFYVRLRQDWDVTTPTLNITYSFILLDDKTKIDLCMAYYDMLKLYADSAWRVLIWQQTSDASTNEFWVYGNAYCDGNKKCLKDLTLNEMREMCSVFQGDDKFNNLEIFFPI